MDQDNVKLGLLMEAAQTHQKLAEAAIEKLNQHMQGLETAVRDQIQRAFGDGLKSVHAETKGAVDALQRVRRAANARTALWTLGVIGIAASVALFVAWWVLPTPTEIAALRTQRDELTSNIAVLNQRGARADLRRCGTGHLCVRVTKRPGMARVPTTWSSGAIKHSLAAEFVCYVKAQRATRRRGPVGTRTSLERTG